VSTLRRLGILLRGIGFTDNLDFRCHGMFRGRKMEGLRHRRYKIMGLPMPRDVSREGNGRIMASGV